MQGYEQCSSLIWPGGEIETQSIAQEVPVAIVYNGVSHAVMLASPLQLEDLALGFSLSEGILNSPSELYGCITEATAQGIELQLEVASRAMDDIKRRRRNLMGRTGCGICGTESLAQLSIKPRQLESSQRPDPAAIEKALTQLNPHQLLQQQTGAVHCAALCDQSGAIVLLREDVGRHNALDKLIGSASSEALKLEQGFVLLSSRASFEMIHKSSRVGVPALVCISAPTSLAIATANEAKQHLIGFARPGRHTLYTSHHNE